MTTPFDPWAVSEADFPHSASDDDQLRFLVRYAVLAPSGHNTQPWCFEVVDGVLEVHADRSRRLPVVDPEDRELVISCGAALEHVCLAARHFRRVPVVDLLPDAAVPDLLARMRFGGSAEPTTDDERRFGAITRRRTRRLPLERRVVPTDVRAALEAEVRDAGAWLAVAEGPMRERIADLVREGGETQGRDPAFRRELASWIRTNATRRHDGMPGYAFGFSNALSFLGPIVIARTPAVAKQATKDRQAVLEAPLVAVVGTTADDPRSWLVTGRAVAGLLLTARAHGIWAAFTNMPIEVARLRADVATAIGRAGEAPQLLLRLGYGADVRPIPRRPAPDVTS